ncbi:branched-chain amino acid transport system II carrier protein [Aliarcobacter cryaerophilus]|uniref:branched-chain amino acid transport system II carrier protein n=1 Tax=Aliarcobacter cryaerophilus TaxID=28198 RepID=UPI0021B50443|nr:branched-chain amino acid transport system II carrier protein [Aliarcobacter cryaerophilus]MCT7482225.1 branched-chain amino acid transport system II carrier protein [Aliarcobacter cryaerophilus]
MKTSNITRDTLILGFAIFSMYFGAGNIIFPPYLGLISSSDWKISFFAYFLADIGFATFAMFALLKVGGNVDNLTSKLGTINGKILMAIIILCIGPLIALPRTGAVTYEMLVVPYFGASTFNSLITSIIYFGLILFFTLRPTSMIEILGKVLSPLLFLSLIILIIKGIFTPIGEISQNTTNDKLFFDGLILGYQTLDILAALAFGIIIIKILKTKGYTNKKTNFKIVGYASLIAAFGIMLVYFGLTYLGATSSLVYETNIEKVTLLNNIIYQLFGSNGAIILAFVVFLACFTTGAALVSVTAEYFSKVSQGRFSYKKLVILTSLFAVVVTNFGLETIINFAAPILFIVYPAAIILVILAVFDNYIDNLNIYKFSSFGAIIYSIFELISNSYLKLSFMENIPLAKEGLGWILPAIIFGIVGFLIKSKRVRSKV